MGHIRDRSGITSDSRNGESPDLQGFLRADAGTRTPDPFITSEVLYQLSYVGICRDFSFSLIDRCDFLEHGWSKNHGGPCCAEA